MTDTDTHDVDGPEGWCVYGDGWAGPAVVLPYDPVLACEGWPRHAHPRCYALALAAGTREEQVARLGAGLRALRDRGVPVGTFTQATLPGQCLTCGCVLVGAVCVGGTAAQGPAWSCIWCLPAPERERIWRAWTGCAVCLTPEDPGTPGQAFVAAGFYAPTSGPGVTRYVHEGCAPRGALKPARRLAPARLKCACSAVRL